MLPDNSNIFNKKLEIYKNSTKNFNDTINHDYRNYEKTDKDYIWNEPSEIIKEDSTWYNILKKIQEGILKNKIGILHVVDGKLYLRDDNGDDIEINTLEDIKKIIAKKVLKDND